MEILWFSEWSKFYNKNKVKKKSSDSVFGIVLIELCQEKKKNELYTLSFGSAHSYLLKIADLNFGLNLAEKLLSENTIDNKTSKFIKQSKRRSHTNYRENYYVTSEIGESNEGVSGKISLNKKFKNLLLYKYKSSMGFGVAVKVTNKEYTPLQMIELVAEVNYMNEYLEQKISLPRILYLPKNNANERNIYDLNTKIKKDLLNKQPKSALVSYLESPGDLMIDETFIKISYNRKSENISYDLTCIQNFLRQFNSNELEIEKVKVKINESSNNIELLRILDFSTELKDEFYCIFNGRWAILNASFNDYINKEIKKVNNVVEIDSRYDLTNQVLLDGNKIRESKPDQYDKNVEYTEYQYNIYFQNKFNYTLLDRKKDHKPAAIEIADWYCAQTEQLIHVKIGNSSDLRYCINQSLQGSQFLNDNPDILSVYSIKKSEKATILFITKLTNIINKDGKADFSNSKSIYLKIELIEWFDKLASMGFTPKIILARDKRRDRIKLAK
ncbi:hypothetical protein CKN80_03870 [Carnobacterium divergens]|nr:hypothetical protein CKN79_03865 [Carnobacterium divergens]TFJ53849.1 hypothetical protein CKN80_03870 [Carnobacterium divergens]